MSETGIRFTRVMDSGLAREFVGQFRSLKHPDRFTSGIAAADYDDDGDVDLYVVGGRNGPNHLYQNQGDGTFAEVGASVGLDVSHWGSGPVFGDVDGDGDLDLFIGAGDGDPVYLFENRLNAADAPAGVFVDRTAGSGITITTDNTVSAAFHDYDRDGYLDLFLAHWGAVRERGADTETVWRSNGDFTFTSTSVETGIADAIVAGGRDWSFTPNLSDIDGDGDGDLLMVSDLNNSEVLINNGDGTFTRSTDPEVIVDQAGMGAAVGDYDNDGDMDWFVTS
ncbi:MAG: VCBS repeat-containing protein, partial [Gammaproteobacteria bacterium]|nr:VCBS repeat-containing protein [Gammaproteobacteria bacterium]